jgi:hypothetical protein
MRTGIIKDLIILGIKVTLALGMKVTLVFGEMVTTISGVIIRKRDTNSLEISSWTLTIALSLKMMLRCLLKLSLTG